MPRFGDTLHRDSVLGTMCNRSNFVGLVQLCFSYCLGELGGPVCQLRLARFALNSCGEDDIGLKKSTVGIHWFHY